MGEEEVPAQGYSKLSRFLVFNPSFGPREGEEKKRLIFYYPKDHDEKTKNQNAGFAAACTNFTKLFFGIKECRSVHTQKTKSVFLQPEPGFWMTLVVSLPFTKKKKARTGPSSAEVIEYSPEEVHENVLSSMLLHSYEMFCFFMGSFAQVLSECEGDRDCFKSRIELFFDKFIPTLRPGHGSALDLFRAIQFLSLECNEFLKVQTFVNRLENEFPVVTKVVMFQERNVVWTDLQQEDTRLLYHYITASLLNSALPLVYHNKNESPTRSGPFTGHQGRFIAGGPSNPNKIDHGDEEVKPLKVFLTPDLGSSKEKVEFQLIVYHAVSSTVCLFVPAFAELTMDFYKMADASMGPHLTNMSADLLDVFGQKGLTSSASKVSLSRNVSSSAIDIMNSVRFLYFNHFNCAMKSTLQVAGDSNLAPETLKLMLDISSDFERNESSKDSEPLESFVKLQNEQWVIGKSADKRKVFVVITSKCATLMDANDELQRLMTTEFKNVFIAEN